MSGTQRLPGGQPRKASQRHSRRAAPFQPRTSRLWRSGDRVRWRDRIGVFHRDLGREPCGSNFRDKPCILCTFRVHLAIIPECHAIPVG